MTRTKSQKQRSKQARQSKVARSRGAPQPYPKRRNMKRRKAPKNAVFLNRQSTSTRLSDCAMKYRYALENPFTGTTACIPTALSVPSMKFNFRGYGNFTTGVNGTGGIVVNPFMTCFSDASLLSANPSPGIMYSGPTYTAVTLPIYTGTGVAAASTNTTFGTAASNPAQIQFRVVACGLRVRNVTSILNRAGSILGLETPTHYSQVSAAIGIMSAQQQSGLGDVNGKWNCLVYHPIDEAELDYTPYNNTSMINSTFANYGVNITPQICNYMLGFIINAPTSTVQTYEYEVYTVAEAIGTLIQGTSPNEADPIGVAAIQNEFNNAEARKPSVVNDSWFNPPSMGAVGTAVAGSAASSFYAWGRGRYYGARHGAPNVL